LHDILKALAQHNQITAEQSAQILAWLNRSNCR
jgi:hypothetical protein